MDPGMFVPDVGGVSLLLRFKVSQHPLHPPRKCCPRGGNNYLLEPQLTDSSAQRIVANSQRRHFNFEASGPRLVDVGCM